MEIRWKKVLVTIVLGAVIIFAGEHFGLIDLSGPSPPVSYLLSPPEVDTNGVAVVVRYWLHVPDGTETATIEELLTDFLIPAIRKGNEGTGADGRKVEADSYRFLVFSTYRSGTEELRQPRIDSVDVTYSWDATDGLSPE